MFAYKKKRKTREESREKRKVRINTENESQEMYPIKSRRKNQTEVLEEQIVEDLVEG